MKGQPSACTPIMMLWTVIGRKLLSVIEIWHCVELGRMLGPQGKRGTMREPVGMNIWVLCSYPSSCGAIASVFPLQAYCRARDLTPTVPPFLGVLRGSRAVLCGLVYGWIDCFK